MPDPPVLDDKSFQHDLNGREFQLYYTGSNLHMVVLRVHGHELLGREHASGLALERDDDRDREGSQAAHGDAGK